MKITGPVCPVTGGLHKLKAWQSCDGRSGFACAGCSKTWEWQNDEGGPILVATYELEPDSKRAARGKPARRP